MPDNDKVEKLPEMLDSEKETTFFIKYSVDLEKTEIRLEDFNEKVITLATILKEKFPQINDLKTDDPVTKITREAGGYYRFYQSIVRVYYKNGSVQEFVIDPEYCTIDYVERYSIQRLERVIKEIRDYIRAYGNLNLTKEIKV